MIEIGSKVKWIVDIDKVYSTDTKTYVGKIGQVVEPKDRAYPPSKYNGNYPGCFDVVFPNGSRGFGVWNIPYYDLEEIIE